MPYGGLSYDARIPQSFCSQDQVFLLGDRDDSARYREEFPGRFKSWLKPSLYIAQGCEKKVPQAMPI